MKFLLLHTFLLPALALSASGALATYSFTGSTANAIGPFSAEGVTPGISASTLVGTNMGSGSTATGGVVTAFFAGTDASSPAYTLDGAGYEVPGITTTNDSTGTIDTAPLSTFVFTITPGANPILYSTLTLDFGYDFNTSAAGTIVSYDLYYSINGGASTRAGGVTTNITGTDNKHGIVADVSRDLSALADFTAPISSPVTFELRFADSNSGSNLKRAFIDDININGSIVPEPSSGLLLLSTGMLFLARRRKGE